MRVETPKGIIQVKESTDENYPGFYVSINGRELILVEYDSLKEKHVIHVWDEKDDIDDPIFNYVLEEDNI